MTGVKGAYKDFGSVSALSGVDLEVGQGELLALVGPSGCGKTTLLRAIAGLETLDSGTITVNGMSLEGLAPADRSVAMVFQSAALFPHLDVAANITFGLKAKGQSAAAVRESLDWVAEQLEAGHLLTRRPSQLSGGECQRVALARAAVERPALFLLDEPLSNLDERLREQIRGFTVKLQRQLQTPMVYVTHDQAEALSMADRVAVMNDGRVIQVGSPESLYLEPVNLFVAEFVGSPKINVIEGKGVVRAIRPEHVKISQLNGGDIEGAVEGFSFFGRETLVSLATDFGVISSLCRDVNGLEAGQRCSLALDSSHLMEFDQRTGERR